MKIVSSNGRDLRWGAFAQISNIILGFGLLISATHALSKADVSNWIILNSFIAFLNIFSLSLEPVITRYVGYLFSGERELLAEGISHESDKSGYQKEVNSFRTFHSNLYQFVWLAVHHYRRLAYKILIVNICTATPYVLYLVQVKGESASIFKAWMIFSIALFLNYRLGYLQATLRGLGQVTDVNKALTLSRITTGFFTLILISFNLQLNAFAVGYLFGICSEKLYAYKKYRNLFLELVPNQNNYNEFKKLVSINYRKSVTISSFAFLVVKGGVIVGGLVLPIDALNKYLVTYTLLASLASVANEVLRINIPKMNSMQIKREKVNLRRIYLESLLGSIALFICLAIAAIIFIDKYAQSFKLNIQLLPSNLIILLVLVLALDINHNVAASYLSTLNKMPFFKAFIISGGLNLIIASALSLRYGVLGIIVSQFLVQLSYNNWKWPYEVLKDLKFVTN